MRASHQEYNVKKLAWQAGANSPLNHNDRLKPSKPTANISHDVIHTTRRTDVLD